MDALDNGNLENLDKNNDNEDPNSQKFNEDDWIEDEEIRPNVEELQYLQVIKFL
jgi:hypothetical protein